MFAAVAPASANPTTNTFDNACHASTGFIEENVSEEFSVTTEDLGSNQ